LYGYGAVGGIAPPAIGRTGIRWYHAGGLIAKRIVGTRGRVWLSINLDCAGEFVHGARTGGEGRDEWARCSWRWWDRG